jgi:hypothetical protein
MKKSLLVMAILVLLLTACLPGQTPEEAQNQINTAVAAAIATQQAAIDQAVAMTLTAVAQNASPTPVPTFVEPNTPTALVFPTLTPIIPTITPRPSGGGGGGGGGGGNSSSQYSCAIISEKPYDGAHFKPGDSFDKTWTIKNTGTVTWGANWDFEYRGGTDMSPTPDFTIGKQVKSGDSITLIIEVDAPNVAAKDAGKTFVMTWSLNNGSHFCTPYVAIKVYPPGTDN